MITGSVAVVVYGEPRLTHDVDLVAVLDRAHVLRLPGAFPLSDYYCPPLEEIEREAARETGGHFNLVHHETGFKADVYPAGRDPLNAWGLSRTRTLELDGEPIVVAPAEYVIVRKLEYFREGRSEKHLRDIRSILEHSPELIQAAELESLIADRGLREVWRTAVGT